MKEEKTRGCEHVNVNRREFLSYLGWATTGLLYTVAGGIPRSFIIEQISTDANVAAEAELATRNSSFSFIQLSDSHVGFSQDPNRDVLGTLNIAVAKINRAETRPDLIIHTGDLTHNSKNEEFDAFDQAMKLAKADGKFYVPGERDVLDGNGKTFRSRYGSGSKGDGWYSLTHKGVHFIGLVNVMNWKQGSMGVLGASQLEWLEHDLESLSSSTPIVVFSHMPLWPICPDWGWGTSDGERALSSFRKFGSATVLCGHTHQAIQKVEGTMFLHAATSTAYPQSYPGTTKSPEPSVVPLESLRSYLGITSVQYFEHERNLSLIDSSLK